MPTAPNLGPLLVCGLAFEARIARVTGLAVATCYEGAFLRLMGPTFLSQGVDGLVSFGTCGALDPRLRPGDWILADSVVFEGIEYPCDVPWRLRLLQALGSAHGGRMFSGRTVVATPAAKAALFASEGARAVDLESGPVAHVARQSGLPFTVCRVVVDPAERVLPPSALAAVDSPGSTAPLSLIASLLRRPQDLGGLVRLASDVATAKTALRRGAKRMKPALRIVRSDS